MLPLFVMYVQVTHVTAKVVVAHMAIYGEILTFLTTITTWKWHIHS